MASPKPGRSIRIVLGSLLAVLLIGVLLFLDGKRVDVPYTAERSGKSEPAIPTPQAPINPGTTDNPK